MDEREYALKEALEKNEQESQRWQIYLKENEKAIENIAMFAKRLTVDVMVPIGKKAFMPGHLLHTNEILVGHYQGYFSKCSSLKAREICELRIKMATEHLKKLETEAELWLNKLDKPYSDGVMPTGEEREIIEEFDEEKEKLFMEKHRIRVKQAKQKEREEREIQRKENGTDLIQNKTNEEIFKMLEEAELMEELEQELDALQVDEVNDETIQKLMTGEMILPEEKKRFVHNKDTTKEDTTSHDKSLSPYIIKKCVDSTHITGNNNVQSNPEIVDLLNSQDQDEDEDTIPGEVKLIKEQAKYLSNEDQIGFYDYQIQIIRQKLQTQPLSTREELDKKIHLLNVLEYLEELLEEAEETVGESELAETGNDVENDEITENKNEITEKKCLNEVKEFIVSKNESDKNQKRRISFALENHTLEYRKHEAVTQMLLHKTEKIERDIIKLNDNDYEMEDKCKLKAEHSIQKTDLIEAKVEQNLQFVLENQSTQDFDLVGKILECSKGVKTLHITFKHSQREGYKCEDTFNTPGSPADFYNFYIKSEKSLQNANESSILYTNGYEGEEHVKVPVLKENDRQTAFADPKSEFSNPIHAKSILRNKSAVEKENFQHSYNSKKSKKKICKNEEDCSSAYYKVMNDVIEKPLTEPEPLPDVKFIDAHTPKKRISHFKRTRQGNEQI